jgi:hypothetical protein
VIDVRRADYPVPIAAEISVAEIVAEEHHNIWRAHPLPLIGPALAGGRTPQAKKSGREGGAQCSSCNHSACLLEQGKVACGCAPTSIEYTVGWPHRASIRFHQPKRDLRTALKPHPPHDAGVALSPLAGRCYLRAVDRPPGDGTPALLQTGDHRGHRRGATALSVRQRTLWSRTLQPRVPLLSGNFSD